MIDYEKFDLNKEVEKIKNTQYSCIDFFNWYGFKKIICELYDLNPSKYLGARVFHSVFLSEYELYLKQSIEAKTPVLCNRLSQVDYLIKKGRNSKNTFATGGLFPLYRRLKNITQNEDAKGTISFPVHVSRHCDITTSYEEYIEKIKKLPEQFQPVDVCLHWRDIENGIHEVFLKNGINVYTAGHCNDPDFCDNFYEILRHYKYATCNYIMSTSLLYAMEMRINVFIYGDEETERKNASGEIYGMTEEEIKEYERAHIDTYNKLFPKYPETEIKQEVLPELTYIMGLDKQSSKKEIRKALLKQKIKNYIKMKTYPIMSKYFANK